MNTKPQQKRLCDYCNETTALLYCRADSAKLCLSCDHEVHSTNQLFSKHTRLLLCDDCHASPVSVYCETEHSALCQICDCERHSLSSSPSTHNRRPIEGFTGCPSGNELMEILGFEDLGHKQSLFFSEETDGFMGSGLDDDYSDLFVWDSPAVSIDDLIMSSDSAPNFQASGAPPLPKEIGEAANQVFLPSTLPGSDFEESCAVPDKEINISDSASQINDGREAEPQPRTTGTLPVLPNAGTHELSSQDRDSAISRYKEKRQTRRNEDSTLNSFFSGLDKLPLKKEQQSSTSSSPGTINESGTNLARFGQKPEQELRVVSLSWIVESEVLQVSGEAQDMEFIATITG